VHDSKYIDTDDFIVLLQTATELEHDRCRYIALPQYDFRLKTLHDKIKNLIGVKFAPVCQES
jgi:hypothetical protein